MVGSKLKTNGTIAETAGFQAAEVDGVASSGGGAGLSPPSAEGLGVGAGEALVSAGELAVGAGAGLASLIAGGLAGGGDTGGGDALALGS